MKLPTTREEYTMWALEHTGIGIFNVRYVLQDRKFESHGDYQLEYDRLKCKHSKWIIATIDQFPDLVRVRKEGKLLFVFVCGIQVASINIVHSRGLVADRAVQHYERNKHEATTNS